LTLRAMGKNWNQIQRDAFPGKTGNACRKRHERLMERRGQNDFDNRKLERLCKEYMTMRKEIWQPLASRCGEKWNVVEIQVCIRRPPPHPHPISNTSTQCMSNGLKNIQSHARAYARRERLESGQPMPAYDDHDAALGCLTPVDDVDVDVADQSYSSPETGGSTTGAHSTPGGSSASAGSAGSHSHPYLHHQHQHPHHSQAAAAGYQGYGGYGHHAPPPQQPQAHHGHGHGHGHGYSNSVSSTGTAGGYGAPPVQQQPQQQQQSQGGSGSQSTSPYMGHGGRLPSVGDMGIDAIINPSRQGS
jgi:hypothetical protein